jgi:hypothetical protein
MDTVLNAFVIVIQSHDNREKLSALQLFKDTHITKLELLSNATTIDSALNFIRSKQQEQHKKHLAEDTNNAAANLDTHKVVNEAQGGRQTVF